MTIRRVVFWAHLVSGLAVGSVIFVMALTGTILAFEPQIVAAAEKHIRQVELSGRAMAPLSVVEIFSKAMEVVPHGKISGFSIKSDPAASVAVSFGREEGNVYLNPYTGEFLGRGSKVHDWMHWVEDIHRRLGAKDKGKAVTGFCNAVFLFMVFSGIYIWWPRNWNLPSLKAITFFNWKLSGKQRDWNWHNVIGFWCLPMLLVTTLTGMIMSYGWANNLLYYLTGSEAPPARMQRGGGPEADAKKGEKNHGEKKERDEKPRLPLTQADIGLIGLEVETRSPGWESMNLRFSSKPGEPMRISIQESKAQYKSPSPRSQMTYDLEKNEVVTWEPFSENSLGRKARIWVKYLHTGEAWGWAGQIVAFLSATGALFLVWTGFALSWRRFFGKK